MTRKSGYYWVKYCGEFVVAEYLNDSDKSWYMAGVSLSFYDSDFDQINETRILSPDEVSDE